MCRFNGKKRILALVAMVLLSTVLLSGCGQIADKLGIEMVEVTLPEIKIPGLEGLLSGNKVLDEGTVSVDAPAGRMPQCVGASYEDAVAALNKAGILATVAYAYSSDVEAGYVISQSIPVDTVPEKGTVVEICVSKGVPEGNPDGYDQKVVVTAASGSSYGKLTLYNWEDGQWVKDFSCDATVGKNGISSNYGEGKKRTPKGTFKLGVALSSGSIGNDGWPYEKTTKDTCIVDEPLSAYYNTIQSIKDLPKGVSYDPVGKTLANSSNILIFIEHNGDGYTSDDVVAGKGSVITICGKKTAIKPTAGCVDISSANMKKLIQKLDYSKKTVIEITVN